MCFGPHLAADAGKALQTLPPEVQEEILDVLERVADETAAASAVEAQSIEAESTIAHRVIYRADETTTYVALELRIDFSERMVILDRLAAVVIER